MRIAAGMGAQAAALAAVAARGGMAAVAAAGRQPSERTKRRRWGRDLDSCEYYYVARRWPRQDVVAVRGSGGLQTPAECLAQLRRALVPLELCLLPRVRQQRGATAAAEKHRGNIEGPESLAGRGHPRSSR